MALKQKAFLLAGLAGLVLVSSPAQATITVYTTLASFNAATTAQGTDTFNNFTNNTSATASPITRTAGSYSYTAATSNLSPDGVDGYGFFGAGSGTDRWLSTNFSGDTVTFNGWASTVRAIGGNFFGSDATGAFRSGNVVLTVTDASGAITRTIVSATTSSFLGFVSTGGLSSLVVASQSTDGTALWPTINNLVLAQAAAGPTVPEPSTWAMMLVGFAMVGASARYRRRKTAVSFA